MTLELVLITSVIDTHKSRDVAVVDIPGAFLTAYMYEYLIMVIQGRLVEPMVKTEPSIYQKFVTIENVWTFLYVKS